MKHEQLQLSFDVLIEPVIKAIADPSWDEVEKATDNINQAFLPSVECKVLDFGVDKRVAPQQNTLIREQLPSTDFDSACKSVGEQVTSDTLKFAPQHDSKLYTQLSEEKTTHWVEKYWVERGTNKYWYYRYMWMEGRKLHRVYIGSVTSNKANSKKQAVSEAILDGQSPQEIKQLIQSFKSQTPIARCPMSNVQP